jgi:methionyl-tRNA synthetase
MLEKYHGGRVPAPSLETEPATIDDQLVSLAKQTVAEYERLMEGMNINEALNTIWRLVGRANKYIDEAAPWGLAKSQTPESQARLANVMYNLSEVIRVVAILVTPFMPTTGEKMWDQLGLAAEKPFSQVSLTDATWGGITVGANFRRTEPLFPRIDVEAEQASGKVDEKPMDNVQGAKAAEAQGTQAQAHAQAQTAQVQPAQAKEAAPAQPELIDIADFAKVELRVGKILQAEKVTGADKLLKLQVDLGTETRQIVSGIAQHYTTEELIGKSIVVVTNLKPAKLRGELSEGMLLAASNPEHTALALVTPERSMEPGAKVK